MSKKIKIIVAVVVLVVIVIGIGAIFMKTHSKKAEKTIISEPMITEILDVSELSTLDSTYNAITDVYTDGEDSTIKYHVAYDATVKVGIDFEKMECSVDDEKKRIIITLPETEIQDVDVDIASLDYIYEDDKYDEEKVTLEAYEACIEDVKKKSASEEELYEMAKENTKSAIEALLKPWVEEIDEEYKIVIK